MQLFYEIKLLDKQSISGYKHSMKENIKKALGLKVKAMRENAHLTQEDLAAICDVSWRTISNLERGLVIPDLLMLCKISKKFSVSIDELLELDFTHQKSISRLEKENLIIEKIKSTDDKLLGYIADQLDLLLRHFK